MIESYELEKEVLAGLSCIAVPIEIFVPKIGEPIITVYSFCRENAEDFEQRFKGDLLCKVAIATLENEFKTIAENIGYRHFHCENEMMLEYAFEPDMQLTNIGCSARVHKISSNAVLRELCENSGCDIEIADDGEDIIFAVVDNGMLLAYAGINDVIYADNSVEISVETAPEHRRKGYGLACVYELTKHLILKGKKVRYKCSEDNLASSALAEKCGFVLEGKRYSYVCERI